MLFFLGLCSSSGTKSWNLFRQTITSLDHLYNLLLHGIKFQAKPDIGLLILPGFITEVQDYTNPDIVYSFTIVITYHDGPGII